MFRLAFPSSSCMDSFYFSWDLQTLVSRRLFILFVKKPVFQSFSNSSFIHFKLYIYKNFFFLLYAWVNFKLLTWIEYFKEIQKYTKKSFPLTRKEVRIYTCIFDNIFRKLVVTKKDGTQNRKWKKRFLGITVHFLW